MILLSFDIEEFDAPSEHGVDLPFEEQMSLSVQGTKEILALLDKYRVKATFFCTANFALHATDLIKEIAVQGHEIASHGYYHSSFEPADLQKSKEVLEQLIQSPVCGYRMARMMPVKNAEILSAGYTYNSSLNPTVIPGRYFNLSKPRRWFYEDGLLQLPASVTPRCRFPLFWLSYHNLPPRWYRWLVRYTHAHDGYFVTYFHPWEFVDLKKRKDLRLPFIMTNHSGAGMVRRLDDFIRYFQDRNIPFGTIGQFLKGIQ